MTWSLFCFFWGTSAACRGYVASSMGHSRVEEERVAQLTKIGKEELEKFVKQKENELAKLEQEYQHALADIGMGHKGVREQEEYEKWKKEKDQRDRELAQFRGDQALKKINYQQVTENKIKLDGRKIKCSLRFSPKYRIRSNTK